MNSLVGDYSDSDEDTACHDEEQTMGMLVARPEVRPTTTATTMPTINADDVIDESVVKRHDWEAKEAPKKPAARKPGERARIVLPSLHVADSDSDDSDDERRQRRRREAAEKDAAPKSNIKLLTMLPKAQNSTAADTKKGGAFMMPYVLSNKRTGGGKQKLSKKPPKVPNAEYMAARKADAANVTADEVPRDFFGFNDSHDVEPDEDVLTANSADIDYRAAEQSTNAAAFSDEQLAAHPSQMYNYANVDDSAMPTAEDPAAKRMKTYNDDAARQMIIRRESQMNNGCGPSASDIHILEANVDRSLGPDVKANLMRSVTGKVHVPVRDPMPLGRDGKPDRLAKHKGHISYLAHLAKEREESLAEASSKQKLSKFATRARYGF